MVVRNCKTLLNEIHDLENQLELLEKLYPEMDSEMLLKIILIKQG